LNTAEFNILMIACSWRLRWSNRDRNFEKKPENIWLKIWP